MATLEPLGPLLTSDKAYGIGSNVQKGPESLLLGLMVTRLDARQ